MNGEFSCSGVCVASLAGPQLFDGNRPAIAPKDDGTASSLDSCPGCGTACLRESHLVSRSWYPLRVSRARRGRRDALIGIRRACSLTPSAPGAYRRDPRGRRCVVAPPGAGPRRPRTPEPRRQRGGRRRGGPERAPVVLEGVTRGCTAVVHGDRLTVDPPNGRSQGESKSAYRIPRRGLESQVEGSSLMSPPGTRALSQTQAGHNESRERTRVFTGATRRRDSQRTR